MATDQQVGLTRTKQLHAEKRWREDDNLVKMNANWLQMMNNDLLDCVGMVWSDLSHSSQTAHRLLLAFN